MPQSCAEGLDDWLRSAPRRRRAGRAGRVPPASARGRHHLGPEEIEERLGRPGFVVVDARAPERYRGEVGPIDSVAGHIPGAVNMPYSGDSVCASRSDSFEDVVYCGSGVTACVNVLELNRAGVRASSTRARGASGLRAAWRSSVADFTVRPARSDDTEAVFQLYADWQTSNYGQVEIGREMYATILASADGAFVAELEGRVVGEADASGGWIDVGVEPEADGSAASVPRSSERQRRPRPPSRPCSWHSK